MHYMRGSLAALEKLGMRNIPPLRERVREDNEPIAPEGNAFDHFDKMVVTEAKQRKIAALGGIMNATGGFKPSGSLGFPSGATQMLQSPKPQMAKQPGANLNPMKPMKPKNVLDPRASKPPGMNLQHQVQENAHTVDVANSMTSPQRRLMGSPL